MDQCPECGYLMDPFEKECPRCKRMSAQPAPAPPPQPIKQVSLPRPALPGAAPPSSEASDADAPLPREIRRPEPIAVGPELGWPLTILLWAVMGLNGVALLLVMLAAVGVQVMLRNEALTHMAGTVVIVAIGIFGLRIVAALAMLNCRRWGFYTYSVFVVLPALLSLIWGGPGIFLLVVDVIPAIAIFALVLSKWNEFE